MKGNKQFSAFDFVNPVLLGPLALAAIYPFLYILSLSLSSNRAIVSGEVFLLPVDWSLFSYRTVWIEGNIFKAMLNSVVITLVGTLFSRVMTVVTAYPLSKEYLKGRSLLMGGIVAAMLFNPGMIPNYLLIRSMGLINSYGALWLPAAINIFNLIIMRTFFQQIPRELEEAAYMDGCNDIFVMVRIIIPLSMPVLATMTLFYAVSYWNDFFAPFIFITKAQLIPLPVKLRQIIMEGVAMNVNEISTIDRVRYYSPEGIKAATIVVATGPILMVYPFLQKYFVKGVMIGAIKA